MIQITGKTEENAVFFPLNVEETTGEVSEVVLKSTSTNNTYTLNVTDYEVNAFGLTINLDLAEIPDGEYTYTINGIDSFGLIRIGKINENNTYNNGETTNKFYNGNNN